MITIIAVFDHAGEMAVLCHGDALINLHFAVVHKDVVGVSASVTAASAVLLAAVILAAVEDGSAVIPNGRTAMRHVVHNAAAHGVLHGELAAIGNGNGVGCSGSWIIGDLLAVELQDDILTCGNGNVLLDIFLQSDALAGLGVRNGVCQRTGESHRTLAVGHHGLNACNSCTTAQQDHSGQMVDGDVHTAGSSGIRQAQLFHIGPGVGRSSDIPSLIILSCRIIIHLHRDGDGALLAAIGQEVLAVCLSRHGVGSLDILVSNTAIRNGNGDIVLSLGNRAQGLAVQLHAGHVGLDRQAVGLVQRGGGVLGHVQGGEGGIGSSGGQIDGHIVGGRLCTAAGNVTAGVVFHSGAAAAEGALQRTDHFIARDSAAHYQLILHLGNGVNTVLIRVRALIVGRHISTHIAGEITAGDEILISGGYEIGIHGGNTAIEFTAGNRHHYILVNLFIAAQVAVHITDGILSLGIKRAACNRHVQIRRIISTSTPGNDGQRIAGAAGTRIVSISRNKPIRCCACLPLPCQHTALNLQRTAAHFHCRPMGAGQTRPRSIRISDCHRTGTGPIDCA